MAVLIKDGQSIAKKKVSARASARFSPLEHQIYRNLSRRPLAGAFLLVAVSSGVDSVSLLHILHKLSSALKLKLGVVHIHHGPGSARVQRFRDRARELVRLEAESLGLPFYTNKTNPKKELKSEDDMRKYRWTWLRKFQKKLSKNDQPVFLALAHHKEDLLETQLIRLVRGVGPQGLKSMSTLQDGILRPFLVISRGEIENYAKKNQVQFLSDPSNKSKDALRNWMRQVWLPALEKKRPGSVSRMALSLKHITESILTSESGVKSKMSSILGPEGIRLAYFLPLSKSEKQRVLAEYMLQLGLKNYTSNHIHELLKRLDHSQGHGQQTFTLLKKKWSLSSDILIALPDDKC